MKLNDDPAPDAAVYEEYTAEEAERRFRELLEKAARGARIRISGASPVILSAEKPRFDNRAEKIRKWSAVIDTLRAERGINASLEEIVEWKAEGRK